MRRGLKPFNANPAASQLAVAPISPMRRGLKLDVIPTRSAYLLKSCTDLPDEEGTETSYSAYNLAISCTDLPDEEGTETRSAAHACAASLELHRSPR